MTPIESLLGARHISWAEWQREQAERARQKPIYERAIDAFATFLFWLTVFGLTAHLAVALWRGWL